MLDNWLIQEWAAVFARVIESMTGEAPQADVQTVERPIGDDAFWWEQNFTVTGGSAWVGVATAGWKEIGGIVLKAAGVEDDDEAGFKSTYQEVLSQAFSGLAQSLSGKLKREITCSTFREAAPGGSGQKYCVDLKLGERTISLSAVFSEQLLNSLQEPVAAVEEKAQTIAQPENEVRMPKSLDLLLDVELPVSVSFGRAQLPLKDVIKLTTGSIVELNRAVSEPVEIIVNNCVIARGQVVVVEGNFGVRIQQVISRQERLRTLR